MQQCVNRRKEISTQSGNGAAASNALKQSTKLQANRRQSGRKKQTIKPVTVGLYASAFIFLVAFVAIGYRPPVEPTAVASVSETSSAQETSVDEVIATSVAANFAEVSRLPVATNVSNLSVSLAAKNELAQTNDTAIAKPQIVAGNGDRRTIVTHTTKKGETVEDVASQYGVTKNTVKWANDLTSDALEPNKKLKILPVDGVVYEVGSDDTVEDIAKKYDASVNRIVAFNNLELTGVKKGDQLIIPSGALPEDERPGYVAPTPTYNNTPASTSGSAIASVGYGNFASGSVGNRYAYGYCTWYAYERRAELGRPIGSFWGNANTWAIAAGQNGFSVSSEPAVGAVFQTAAGGGGYGHVGIIESIDAAAGTLTYTDMNGVAGWGSVGRATISISQAKAQWVFIH